MVFKFIGDFKKIDALSLGDVFLAGAFGAWLGVCGGPTFLVAVAVAYLVYAIPRHRKGVVWTPMGPALGIGFMTVAVSGLRFI